MRTFNSHGSKSSAPAPLGEYAGGSTHGQNTLTRTQTHTGTHSNNLAHQWIEFRTCYVTLFDSAKSLAAFNVRTHTPARVLVRPKCKVQRVRDLHPCDRKHNALIECTNNMGTATSFASSGGFQTVFLTNCYNVFQHMLWTLPESIWDLWIAPPLASRSIRPIFNAGL